MSKYALMYRLGVTPWERYARVSREPIVAVLGRERADRGGVRGRALDLGCGHGLYTRELARRGWEAVGVDAVPRAIDEARAVDATHGATFVVGDVTDLATAGVDGFDLFLDIGCFQSLGAEDRAAVGRGVTATARPGATLLMLAFGRTPWRRLIEGVSQAEIETAFPAWRLESSEPAPTRGLGWPMNRTRPRWYRLRLQDDPASVTR